MAKNICKNYEWAIYLSVILIGVLFHYLCGLKTGMAVPTVHDEFAYLLAADTFAHGRLSNPTPLFWEHFQTFHVFLQPTYQAKYPPAQGMFLAVGQLMFNAPIWGVWISMGLAYAATYWLFRSVFTPTYAVMGTLLVVINPHIWVAWGHSYWGGSVAMLGGALFLGGIKHSLSERSLARTLLLGAGMLILANSRPFEGFIIGMLAMPVLLSIALKGLASEGLQWVFQRYIIPLSAVGVLLVLWFLYYNAALSGDPLKFYYHNWDHNTSTVELIKNYRGSPPLTLIEKLTRLREFFLGPYLSFAAIGLLFLAARKKMLFEMVCIVILIAVSIHHSRAWPHYVAPLASLFYLVLFCGMDEVRHLVTKRYKRWPNYVFIALVGLYLGLAFTQTLQNMERGPIRVKRLLSRIAVAEKLRKDATRDLIFVHYDTDHFIHEEWVYNAADMEKAELIWARSLGEEKDQRLMDHFRLRDVWHLYPDRTPIQLNRTRRGTSKNDVQ